MLGNIFEKRLKEVLESTRAQSIITGFERHILTEDLCKRCDFIRRLT